MPTSQGMQNRQATKRLGVAGRPRDRMKRLKCLRFLMFFQSLTDTAVMLGYPRITSGVTRPTLYGPDFRCKNHGHSNVPLL